MHTEPSTPSAHTQIHKMKDGYCIYQSGGNPVYLPEDMISFCNDWLGGISLIAAAPELLAALKEARQYLWEEEARDVGGDTLIMNIDTVIAKAENRA